MNRKIGLIFLMFASLTALPSSVSARPVLTHPTGTVLASGNTFVATNIGNVVFTSPVGSLICNAATMTGVINSNSTSNGVSANITSASIAGTGSTISGEPNPECTGEFGNSSVTVIGLPWCLEANENGDFIKIRGNACSGAQTNLAFTQVITIFGSPVTCTYERINLVNGSLQTDVAAGDATISISGSTGAIFFIRSGSSGACPSQMSLDTTFTLETDRLFPEPLYFSS
jgi:hypothetical protein